MLDTIPFKRKARTGEYKPVANPRKAYGKFIVYATPLNSANGTAYVAKRFKIATRADYSAVYMEAYDFAKEYEATYAEVCDVVFYGAS